MFNSSMEKSQDPNSYTATILKAKTIKCLNLCLRFMEKEESIPPLIQLKSIRIILHCIAKLVSYYVNLDEISRPKRVGSLITKGFEYLRIWYCLLDYDNFKKSDSPKHNDKLKKLERPGYNDTQSSFPSPNYDDKLSSFQTVAFHYDNLIEMDDQILRMDQKRKAFQTKEFLIYSFKLSFYFALFYKKKNEKENYLAFLQLCEKFIEKITYTRDIKINTYILKTKVLILNYYIENSKNETAIVKFEDLFDFTRKIFSIFRFRMESGLCSKKLEINLEKIISILVISLKNISFVYESQYLLHKALECLRLGEYLSASILEEKKEYQDLREMINQDFIDAINNYGIFLKERGEAEIVLNMFEKKTNFYERLEKKANLTLIAEEDQIVSNINESLYKKYNHEAFNRSLFIPVKYQKSEKNLQPLQSFNTLTIDEGYVNCTPKNTYNHLSSLIFEKNKKLSNHKDKNDSDKYFNPNSYARQSVKKNNKFIQNSSIKEPTSEKLKKYSISKDFSGKLCFSLNKQTKNSQINDTNLSTKGNEKDTPIVSDLNEYFEFYINENLNKNAVNREMKHLKNEFQNLNQSESNEKKEMDIFLRKLKIKKRDNFIYKVNHNYEESEPLANVNKKILIQEENKFLNMKSDLEKKMLDLKEKKTPKIRQSILMNQKILKYNLINESIQKPLFKTKNNMTDSIIEQSDEKTKFIKITELVKNQTKDFIQKYQAVIEKYQFHEKKNENSKLMTTVVKTNGELSDSVYLFGTKKNKPHINLSDALKLNALRKNMEREGDSTKNSMTKLRMSLIKIKNMKD